MPRARSKAATLGGSSDDTESAFYEALQRGDIDLLDILKLNALMDAQQAAQQFARAQIAKAREPARTAGQLPTDRAHLHEALGIGECLFVLKLRAVEVPERRAAAPSGDCSAHCGFGVLRLYSCVLVARTLPFSESRMAFVPLVPMSIPR